MFVPHASEQNHIVQTIRNYELFDQKKKQQQQQQQQVDAIFEDVSVAETINAKLYI